ncbi:MAG: hypothetical protein HC896_09520 [Bacteroidales bacterium]|nr:hypothetical protein [Bacteroidales bacterium]
MPSSNAASVTTLANLMLGWRLEFMVVLADNAQGREVYSQFKKNMMVGTDDNLASRIVKLDGYNGIEDILSTIDFKRYVLNKRVGITELNSEYIESNGLSRPMLASNFIREITTRSLTESNFDDETIEKVGDLFRLIKNYLSMP